MALKEWNTNFRLEYFIRKNRTTLSDVLLLPNIFREIRLESTEHHFLCLPNGKICLVYNTCGYFASRVVFFQAPQRVRKNTSYGRNVRSYYMLNHRIRGLLFHYKKELLFCNWLPLFLVRVFRNILIPSVRMTLTMSKMCKRFEPRSHFKSRLCLIVGVNVVLNRTVVVDSDYSPHESYSGPRSPGRSNTTYFWNEQNDRAFYMSNHWMRG